ncbi:hypothetical protein SASPL_146083 [Salvia splendens]|uniref:Syntaxin 5 n=1 Tax=Salvia splendens TaxID=180675 RepID=A0A8X8WI59_SALSN|nr:hypothetical protein SASPL_146083 [Salvia splendens]
MAAVGASPFRDRTSEFVSLSQTLRRIGGSVAAPAQPQLNESIAVTPDRSEFNKKASRIGLRVHQTAQKIDRLSNCMLSIRFRLISCFHLMRFSIRTFVPTVTKRSSIFDDRSKENEKLTGLIKNDITALNMAISELQNLQTMEVADGNYTGDRVVHLTAVCDDLKNRLMNVTKQFQDVLTTTTKNIKARENRKQLFSTAVPRENPFALKQPPNTVSEPPPWLSSSDSSRTNLQQSLNQCKFFLAGPLQMLNIVRAG